MQHRTTCSFCLKRAFSVSASLQTVTYVEHQVDKRCELGNSLDRVRCSWEGSFHACKGGFCQRGHDDAQAGDVTIIFIYS